MFCHEGPWHRVDRIWSMRLGAGTQARSSPHDEHGNRRPRVLRRRRQDRSGTTCRRRAAKCSGWRSRAPMATRALVSRGSRSMVGALQHLARRQAVRRRRRRRGNGGAREGRQVAVPVHAAGNPRCRGNLGAECRRPGAPGTSARRAPGRHEASTTTAWNRTSFSRRDGKWLIFRSNMHGDVHTYMVELAEGPRMP